jgi:predicted DsbA family dithiol-disulfide isomerase
VVESGSTGVRIEIWSDVVCPWCFVGKRRLEKALAGFPHADEVEVVYRSFELDPSAPRHGHELTTPVLARKYGRPEDEMRDMQQQLIDLAATEGLAFRLFENVHTSTGDAHRLLHLALDQGGPELQGRLKESLLSAYFEDAADIGDHAVLRREVLSVGLDPERVDEVLGSDEYAGAVAADVDAARDLGVGGVPFFVVDRRYAVSGAQPTEVFTQLLDRAWAESHPAVEVLQGAPTGEACGIDGSGC